LQSRTQDEISDILAEFEQHSSARRDSARNNNPQPLPPRPRAPVNDVEDIDDNGEVVMRCVRRSEVVRVKRTPDAELRRLEERLMDERRLREETEERLMTERRIREETERRVREEIETRVREEIETRVREETELRLRQQRQAQERRLQAENERLFAETERLRLQMQIQEQQFRQTQAQQQAQQHAPVIVVPATGNNRMTRVEARKLQRQTENEMKNTNQRAIPPVTVLRKDHVKNIEGDFDGVIEEMRNTLVPPRKSKVPIPDVPLFEKCNFDIRNLFESIRTVTFCPAGEETATEPVSIFSICNNIMFSPEQSDKSFGIAVLAISASWLNKPFFCMVVDKKSNVGNLSEKKMSGVLNRFGIETLWIKDGIKQLQGLSKETVSKIRTGKVAVFSQGHDMNISAVDWFIKHHKIYDTALVLDEADAMLSSAVVDGKPVGKSTARQRKLTNLIMSPHADEIYNAHIRCVHFISATHLPTAQFVKSLCEGYYNSHIVDLELLKSRGYAISDCIVPIADDEGKFLFLDKGMQNQKNRYNLNSPLVDKMMDRFVNDLTEDLPIGHESGRSRRTGGLLMAVLSPFVYADNRVNSQDVACHLMDLYRKKCLAKPTAQRPKAKDQKDDDIAVIGIVACQGEPIVYTLTWDGESRLVSVSELLGNVQVVKKKKGNPILVDDVIELIDKRYGLDMPIIVSGFACIKRCISVRGNERVITHIIVSPTTGINVGDTHQTVMRPGGKTVDVRKANGFGDKVPALMQESDYYMIQSLHELTSDYLMQQGRDVSPETAKRVVTIGKARPLATGGCGKQMLQEAISIVNRSEGRPDRRPRRDGDMDVDDRDEALDSADIGNIVDPGLDCPMSVQYAVRLSDRMMELGHHQDPGFFEYVTETDVKKTAIKEAFAHFEERFGVTFDMCTPKPKDGDAAQPPYHAFVAKYKPYPASKKLAGIVLLDNHDIDDVKKRYTAYILFNKPGNNVASGSNIDTYEWKIFEDKETRRYKAVYTKKQQQPQQVDVAMTDLDDIDDIDDIVPAKRAKQLAPSERMKWRGIMCKLWELCDKDGPSKWIVTSKQLREANVIDKNHHDWTQNRLKTLGLIESVKSGVYRITDMGYDVVMNETGLLP
jgi:hypothetical protein